MTRIARHLAEDAIEDLDTAREPAGRHALRPEHASQPGLVAEAVELQREADEAAAAVERDEAERWLDAEVVPVAPVFKMPVPVAPTFLRPQPVAPVVVAVAEAAVEPEPEHASAAVVESPEPVSVDVPVFAVIATEPEPETAPVPTVIAPAAVAPAPEPTTPSFLSVIDTVVEPEPVDEPTAAVVEEPVFSLVPDAAPEEEPALSWLPDADPNGPEPERAVDEQNTDAEVHIHHHHYESAPVPVAPVAQRVIVVADERPEYVEEMPADLPDYVDFGNAEPARRADPGPLVTKPAKEPLFRWGDKPLFVGGNNDVPVADAQGFAVDSDPLTVIPDQTPRPVRPAPKPRKKRKSATPPADGNTVDPQTWFEATVQECLRLGVSDLHIAVENDGETADDAVLSSRIRIDGQMRDYMRVVGEDATVIINRFKAEASLTSSGSFVPQETTWEIEVEDDVRKARIALFPTATGGEALVLRLPPTGALKRLDQLEFAPSNLELFYSLLRSSNRMVVIAGPMGSGKTTTAHAALAHVATPNRTVWSVEDPVERVIGNLTQLELDEKNGAGFDAFLPVLVRSDYDTLFLGEIRDKGTAAAGVKQSKAGRQVITTIHANDNVTALQRLIELAEDSPMSVLNSVLGVVSQRLVRKLNPAWDSKDPDTKYKGRAPIHEVLRVNDELVEAITREQPIAVIKAIAAKISDSTFETDTKRLIAAGITDQEEVDRVLGSE